MKKIIIILGVIAFVGLAWWLGSPLFINKTVNEGLKDIAPGSDMEILELGSGFFEGLAGHSGEGTAELIEISGKSYVRFENDFKVTNGPDLFVYLGRGGKYNPEASLGVLKGNVGSQNYEIPDGLNLADYDEVWVWCRAFSVPFAKAVLK